MGLKISKSRPPLCVRASNRASSQPDAPPPGPQTSASTGEAAQVRARFCPVEWGARHPGPCRGPGPGTCLPRRTGGKAPWPRSGPRSGRRSAPVEREGRRACISGGTCGAGTYSMGDHLREVVQIFSEARCARQPSLGTWWPGGRRPAGRWSGLREREGHDANVGGIQDARPPARARPGGAGRVQARPGEGRCCQVMLGRPASASPSICWPGEGQSAERWRGVKHGAGHDGDVGGRQDAHPPARARPGGACLGWSPRPRVSGGPIGGVRPGEGTA